MLLKEFQPLENGTSDCPSEMAVGGVYVCVCVYSRRLVRPAVVWMVLFLPCAGMAFVAQRTLSTGRVILVGSSV